MEDIASIHWDEEECVSVALDGVRFQSPASCASGQGQRRIPWADLSGPGRCGPGQTSMIPPVPEFGPPCATEPSSWTPPQPSALRHTPGGARAPVSASARVNPFSSFGFMTLTVPACDYKANPSDPVDVAVARHLQALCPEATMAFSLRRLAPSRYEIDGRVVSLHWSASSELYVLEDALNVAEDKGDPGTPLALYLSDMASIAMRLRQPFKPRTLTFVGQDNIHGEDRFTSMQLACRQARLREEAADACRF